MNLDETESSSASGWTR